MARFFRPGFTMLDTLLAVLFIGLGLAAAMQLVTVCTLQTAAAANMTVATTLANDVQELLAPVSYASLASFNGVLYGADAVTPSSPVDAAGQPLTAFNQYTQRIRVYLVSHKDLSTVAATDEGVRKVVVQILYRPTGATSSGPVCSQSFLRFNDK